MDIESDLDTSAQSFTSDNASSNGNKRTMFKMCLLAVIFLAFSLEVTSIIITEKIYLGQALNSTSFCLYTEDFQLSESNKLTLCVKEKTLHIEIDRLFIGSKTSQSLWLSDEEWNKFKSISNEYLLI